VAATALCQAHTRLLLRKETNFNARQGLTNKRGNKILSCFGNERNGKKTHISITIKKYWRRDFWSRNV